MTITVFDAYRGPASAIRVRVAPIDVGFDLRAEGVAVDVGDATVASFASRDGTRMVVEGTTEEVRAALVAAGYAVRS